MSNIEFNMTIFHKNYTYTLHTFSSDFYKIPNLNFNHSLDSREA